MYPFRNELRVISVKIKENAKNVVTVKRSILLGSYFARMKP